jgi:hypothetical protein
MSRAIDLATKETYQLVDFVHGGGAAYYTDWTSDVFYGGNLYISTPDMEVKLPINDGLFGENECKVAIPLVSGDSTNDTFAERISNGQPHAPVVCIVREILKSTLAGPSQTVNSVFSGRVHITAKNHRGRSDKILLRCRPIKAQLATISVGIPCHHLCANGLGDVSCKVDMGISNRTVAAVISVIDGREVTLSANGIIEAAANRFFHRGYIEFEDLFIGIQEWRSAEPLKFFMVEQPPAHWAGQVVSVVAGCDKSIDTCRGRFANEANFLGLGISMPSYDPNIEGSP